MLETSLFNEDRRIGGINSANKFKYVEFDGKIGGNKIILLINW